MKIPKRSQNISEGVKYSNCRTGKDCSSCQRRTSEYQISRKCRGGYRRMKYLLVMGCQRHCAIPSSPHHLSDSIPPRSLVYPQLPVAPSPSASIILHKFPLFSIPPRKTAG